MSNAASAEDILRTAAVFDHLKGERLKGTLAGDKQLSQGDNETVPFFKFFRVRAVALKKKKNFPSLFIARSSTAGADNGLSSSSSSRTGKVAPGDPLLFVCGRSASTCTYVRVFMRDSLCLHLCVSPGPSETSISSHEGPRKEKRDGEKQKAEANEGETRRCPFVPHC